MSYQGSMRGSGIDSKHLTVVIFCKNLDCNADLDEVDVITNDDGGFTNKCPECGEESTYEKEDY